MYPLHPIVAPLPCSNRGYGSLRNLRPNLEIFYQKPLVVRVLLTFPIFVYFLSATRTRCYGNNHTPRDWSLTKQELSHHWLVSVVWVYRTKIEHCDWSVVWSASPVVMLLVSFDGWVHGHWSAMQCCFTAIGQRLVSWVHLARHWSVAVCTDAGPTSRINKRSVCPPPHLSIQAPS